ncbi:SDR family NAD(P)-dependent oxidoreductase [Saccharopolyspora sp. NFXS83]|uniref:SDR family NAD(P)-dependent oxidoreductase n=1 Tax=Saccharopolyspora sp. NFXS83 TaxID=2993560 RepID=UPI00224A5B00|nr:SDR family NAD(P)-dependent oxidoreductase [Saccharopolyspora sp. NFXS83]MCX2732981.1 SDR family NAD(P)-dependent oxidoreductase [Saccharopolyspora sp. NFXS83]
MSLITTPFGSNSTADEVAAGHDLTGKRAVVTGAASGIGVETARALARAGAEVTIGVRDLAAGRTAAEDIAATTGSEVRVAELDLLDLDGVRRFAGSWRGPLHLLINNAGVMAVPELRRTPEGWEQQFATNHLGHFELATGLHAALAEAEGARIVAVSSSGHHASPVVFDDLHYEHRPYDPWSAYGQSKSANALFAVEATRRWSGDGIHANSLMPGGIMTGLQRHVPAETRAEWSRAPMLKTPQQGAATTLVAALAPEFAEVGGKYLEDCAESPVIPDDAETTPVSGGVRRWALDPEAAERLWEVSRRLLDDAA